jgi:cytochrome b6-f complex iron-sulfur subunit
VGHDKNPTPPDETTPGTPPAKEEPASANAPSVKELLAAARGDVTPAPPSAKAPTAKAPPAKAAPPTTPASPPAKAAGTNATQTGGANVSETSDAGPAQETDATRKETDATREVPAATPPAARVSPGAAKAGSTPTAGVAKGIPKTAAAKAAAGPVLVQSAPDTPVNKLRRRIVWASIIAFLGTSLAMFLRFFLPRAIFEPANVFRIGFPGDYNTGVDTKWQQQQRIWVVKTSDRLFIVSAVCTHLGCTPDWKSSENKFKCPCHGSGYDSDGINFEGPAPRPMDRAHVELDAEGQIVVDKSKLYMWPKGERNQFNDEGSYIQL